MTFQEFQEQMVRRLGEDSSGTLDHVKQAVNLAYREMCGISPQSWVREQKDLVVAGGGEAYALDAACRKVLRLRPPVTVTGIIRIVDNETWNEIVTDYDATGQPEMARVEDRGAANEMKLYLHPIPGTASATYKYDGEFLPTDLSANDDTPAFGSEWDACLLDGAIYHLSKILGESDVTIGAAHQRYTESLTRFAGDMRSGADLKGA